MILFTDDSNFRSEDKAASCGEWVPGSLRGNNSVEGREKTGRVPEGTFMAEVTAVPKHLQGP